MSEKPAAPNRRGVWRLLAFLLLALAALEFLVSRNARLWQAYSPEPYRERREACRAGSWDLVVVGGSPVLYGVDPSVLSGVCRDGRPLDRVCNLGLPLATASEIQLAVEHDLPNPPPRLLVYGASATDFNEDRVEPHGPRQLMDVGDAIRWVRARPASAGWCLRQFTVERAMDAWALYSYRNGIRLWAADQAERLWPGACPEAAAEARAGLAASARRAAHSYQGVAPTPDGRLDCLKAAGKIDDSTFSYMDNYRLDAGGYLRCLDRMLNDVRRRGVPVVLCDMPVPADLDARLYPHEFAAYRAALATAARKHGAPVLWATREAVGLSDADFADLVHLNSDGAAKLSVWLRGRLTAPTGEASP